MLEVIRRGAALCVAGAIVIAVPSVPRAQQSVPAIDRRITYILPQWDGINGPASATVQTQVQQLRSRLGPDGPRVKLGFTTYISVAMEPVDPNDTLAVRAALSSTFEQVDAVIANGAANSIPVCLSFVTYLRSRTDALQDAAQAEDRRNMQWHSDGSLASGWTTLSRYARKQEQIQEAFIRELGRGLAARMLQYPEIVVAASGDGEVELSYEKSPQFGGVPPNQPAILADYSPFAVEDFRDWLRGAGLYGVGQPFQGEAYRNSARYASDASLATLNSDFNTNFDTWNLKYEDWSLTDQIDGDPHAIPASVYGQAGWSPVVSNANGFDPPRTHTRGNAWSDLWDEFRQTMVWRHNREFAKWITTSADPNTGATVPVERWFTDQIPADYLFGFTPANPDVRLDTSASPFWTADVSPYGSLGITSFNAYDPKTGTVFRTLNGVAPKVAERRVRWGIFEWSPSVPVNPDDNVYRAEMALVEQYQPSLLAPFFWNNPDYPIENTGFETALRELVARLRVIPLTLSRSTLVAAATTDGANRTPAQTVRVGGAPGETPPWTISSASDFLAVAVAADGRSFTVAPKAQPYAPGPLTGTVVIASSDPGYSPVTLTVALTVKPAGTTGSPSGSFDTPGNAAVVSGEVGVTGWAVDDLGVTAVDIYRSPMANEPAGANGLVFLGSATLVPGARPDVLTAFPDRPLAEQAGWGYMLLTNMLPSQGNGLFVLHAIARDVEGHQVTLGSRTINCQNSTSALPFGTIDTPGQGQTVSGTIVNFGWALSPALIAANGSTIGVYIDNVFVGRPTYNQFRADIAALFPGYPNTNGAVGFFTIDTTRYANGVHTIAWVVTDSSGGARGIGSRYFTIANP